MFFPEGDYGIGGIVPRGARRGVVGTEVESEGIGEEVDAVDVGLSGNLGDGWGEGGEDGGVWRRAGILIDLGYVDTPLGELDGEMVGVVELGRGSRDLDPEGLSVLWDLTGGEPVCRVEEIDEAVVGETIVCRDGSTRQTPTDIWHYGVEAAWLTDTLGGVEIEAQLIIAIHDDGGRGTEERAHVFPEAASVVFGHRS